MSSANMAWKGGKSKERESSQSYRSIRKRIKEIIEQANNFEKNEMQP